MIGSRRIGPGLQSRPEDHRASPIKPRTRRKLRPVVLLPKDSLECSNKVSSKATRMPRSHRSSSACLSHTCHSLLRKKTAVVILPLRTPGSRSTPQTRVVVANTEVSIVTAEWANKPICMQAQAALDAIQSGTPLAGNLVVVRDANQATQISTYYSTHALTECITLLLPGPRTQGCRVFASICTHRPRQRADQHTSHCAQGTRRLEQVPMAPAIHASRYH